MPSDFGKEALKQARKMAKMGRRRKQKELTSRGYPGLARDLAAKGGKAKEYDIDQAIKTHEQLKGRGQRRRYGG